MIPSLMTWWNAASSAVILFALVTVIHDLTHACGHLRGARRLAYQTTLSVVLGLIGFGEALTVFDAVLGHLSVPRVSEVVAATGWAFLGGWLVVLRPFRDVQILCWHRTKCPIIAGGEKADAADRPAAQALPMA